MNINSAANKVLGEFRQDKEQEVFIDPATITVICAILSAVFSALRLWCQWKQGQKADGQQIKETCMIRPLWLQRRVYSIVRRNTDRGFDRRGLTKAILKAGADATPEYIETVFESLENDGAQQEI